ncbi:MAG: hypothetical protein BJ554DRAFT_3564, partial [Olpidium bornovanus]
MPPRRSGTGRFLRGARGAPPCRTPDGDGDAGPAAPQGALRRFRNRPRRLRPERRCECERAGRTATVCVGNCAYHPSAAPPAVVRWSSPPSGPLTEPALTWSPSLPPQPCYVNSDHFTGYVCLRLAKPDTTHVAVGENRVAIPDTDYFKSKSRMFSLHFTGRFKATNPSHPHGYWTADDLEYVVQFEGPVKNSRYVAVFAKVVKMVAPALDIQHMHLSERPYAAAKVFTSCNALSAHIFDQSRGSGSIPKDPKKVRCTGSPALDPGQWEFGGAKELEENLDILAPSLIVEEEPKKKLVLRRRKHFAAAENRKKVELRPDMVIGADLFNPNFNPASGLLEMNSRLKLNAGNIINNQPIRW